MRKFAHSVADVAQITGLCATTIKEAIRNGQLEARKANRRTIILDTALVAWMEGLPKINAKAGNKEAVND